MKRDRILSPVFLVFPCGSAGKESTRNGTWVPSLVGKILWRRERLSTPVFWLEEFRVMKSWTQLSDFHFHFSRIKLRLCKKVTLGKLSEEYMGTQCSLQLFCKTSIKSGTI